MNGSHAERAALKLAAFLTGYPDKAFRRAWREVPAALDAAGPALRPRWEAAAAALRAVPAAELEAHYVEMFDFGADTGLALTFHEHGDARGRGQALADLKAILARAGFRPGAGILPDHLPLLMEFLAVAPAGPDREELAARVGRVAALLGERLERRGSPYAAIWRAAAALLPVGELGLRPVPRQDPKELFALPYPLLPASGGPAKG